MTFVCVVVVVANAVIRNLILKVRKMVLETVTNKSL